MDIVSGKPVHKRVRSANFSLKEKSVLFNIIHKHKNIIENKKTDCVTNEQKALAWKEITSEFNSISPNLCARSTDSLKKWFDNKKKEIRKEVAEEKKQTFLTDGGLPVPAKKDENQELILSIIDQTTVFGTNNPWDSDGQKAHPKLNAESVVYELESEDICDFNVSDSATLAGSCDNDKNSVTIIEGIQNSENKTKWKKYCPNDLRLPSSIPETSVREKRTSETEVNSTSKKTKFEFSRRRPATQVKALTTSEIAKKYDVLMDKRLEIAELTKQSLLLDIEIKKSSIEAVKLFKPISSLNNFKICLKG